MRDVLLLGAGASLGARIDFPTRPPLGRGLAGYLLRWLDENDPALPTVTRWPRFAPNPDPLIVGPGPWDNRELLAEVRAELEKVRAQDAQTDAPHFEDLMNRWAQAPIRDGGYRGHLEFTQQLLAYSMNFGHACAFLDRRDLFDDLLAFFKPSVIVTVNYDLLVEQALVRLSMRDSHPGIPGPTVEGLVAAGTGPIVPLFKLHGSVDWFPGESGAVGADAEAVAAAANANPLTPRPNDGRGRGPYSYDTNRTFEASKGTNLRFVLEDGYSPVVAVYGRGKPLLRNLAHVKAHREACSKLLAEGTVGRVLAVGIRPVSTDDDPTVYELTRWLGKNAVERVYASPTPEHCKEFEAIGFSAKCVGLAEYLDGGAVTTKSLRGTTAARQARAVERVVVAPRTSGRKRGAAKAEGEPRALPAAATAWDSPELRPALVRKTEEIRASWSIAAREAPTVSDAPEVARVLDSLCAVLKDKLTDVEVDDARVLGLPPLRVLTEAERRAGLQRLDKAARQILKLLLVDQGTAAADAKGGRPSDRADAAGYLAEAMDRCLTPAHGKPLTADELADSFLTFVANAEPIAGELKRRGLLRAGLAAQQADRGTRAAVTATFGRDLAPGVVELKGKPDGQRLVALGLVALGYCTRAESKHLYSYARKRDVRPSRA